MILNVFLFEFLIFPILGLDVAAHIVFPLARKARRIAHYEFMA